MVKPAATQHKVTQGHSRSLKVTQDTVKVTTSVSFPHYCIPISPLSRSHTHTATHPPTHARYRQKDLCAGLTISLSLDLQTRRWAWLQSCVGGAGEGSGAGAAFSQ